jgi:hypothetical protein
MASRILDRRAVTFGLAGALCMPSTLRAQTNYPDRPINVIVPFAAGGPTDAIARVYAEFLSRALGQTLVIENVAGRFHTVWSQSQHDGGRCRRPLSGALLTDRILARANRSVGPRRNRPPGQSATAPPDFHAVTCRLASAVASAR